jgi:hypothetical protein
MAENKITIEHVGGSKRVNITSKKPGWGGDERQERGRKDMIVITGREMEARMKERGVTADE